MISMVLFASVISMFFNYMPFSIGNNDILSIELGNSQKESHTLAYHMKICPTCL